MMRNSVMYLTRRCPYNCDYCGIVDNTKKRSDELTVDQWHEAFSILEVMGIEFNLVLGNEPWLLGEEMAEIISATKIPSAVYTTAQESLWRRYHKLFFLEYELNNFSIGVDVPRGKRVGVYDDSLAKAFNAWDAFDWIKANTHNVECHATVTLHAKNFRTVPKLIQQLDEIEVFSNINFVHWNKDGNYDFFGSTEKLQPLLFKEEELDEVEDVLAEVLENQKLLQNPEMLAQPVEKLVNMGWHCNGDPYGGPTINADGTLRVCGYRKGTRTPQFSIFDLPMREEEWKKAVYDDAMECPGCQWSCSWMFNYWKVTKPEKGTDIFTKHKVIL